MRALQAQSWPFHGCGPGRRRGARGYRGAVMVKRSLLILSVLIAQPPELLQAASGSPARPAAPLEVAQDLGKLAEGLDSTKPRVRHGAVDALADVGTPEAWSLILERGLSDPNSRVADSAQLRLGAAPVSPELLGLLESRSGLGSRRAMCRVRVAQALGGMPGEVPARLLERALKDKEPEVRCALAAAVEQRSDSGADSISGGAADMKRLLKALDRVATRDRDPRTRSAGLLALVAFSGAQGIGEEEAQGATTDALASDDPLLVSAAVHTAAERLSAADLEGILWAKRGGHASFMAAVTALEGRADRESAQLLIRRLGDEQAPLRPAAAWGIVRALREISGLSIAGSAKRWQQWADGLAAGKVTPVERRPTTDDGPTTTALYGLKIRGDRVAFLVDMSGSMWVDHQGAPRKEAVDAELARALRALPPTARFDLVPYSKQPAPWRGELVDATPKNVERAVKAFRGCGLKGVGDLWGALESVLVDPEVDTVVILTDGAPSGGDRWNIELMGRLLGDEKRLRHMDLQMVLFGSSKGLKRRWIEVLDGLGGSVLSID